jgi:hypothetical protein
MLNGLYGYFEQELIKKKAQAVYIEVPVSGIKVNCHPNIVKALTELGLKLDPNIYRRFYYPIIEEYDAIDGLERLLLEAEERKISILSCKQEVRFVYMIKTFGDKTGTEPKSTAAACLARC